VFKFSQPLKCVCNAITASGNVFTNCVDRTKIIIIQSYLMAQV